MTTEERKAEDARFRQEYPLFAQYPELIYLDNAATTQKPSCVIQAESAFYEKYNAWRLLFDKKDTKENRRTFLEWMQHEN